MTGQDLLKAIGDIDDRFIEAADARRPAKRTSLIRYRSLIGLAAALIVLIGVGTAIRFGRSASSADSARTAGSGQAAVTAMAPAEEAQAEAAMEDAAEAPAENQKAAEAASNTDGIMTNKTDDNTAVTAGAGTAPGSSDAAAAEAQYNAAASSDAEAPAEAAPAEAAAADADEARAEEAAEVAEAEEAVPAAEAEAAPAYSDEMTVCTDLSEAAAIAGFALDVPARWHLTGENGRRIQASASTIQAVSGLTEVIYTDKTGTELMRICKADESLYGISEISDESRAICIAWSKDGYVYAVTAPDTGVEAGMDETLLNTWIQTYIPEEGRS